MRNAKIVCTLGPASDSKAQIRDLAEAGMSVARLNASHGSPEDRKDVIDRIRAVDEEVDRSLAVMHDIPGPEVRTADIDEPIYLEGDSRVRFFEGDTATPEDVGLSVDISVVEPGDSVLLDDGRIETTVEEVDGSDVYVHIENGGELKARKGVNVPGVDLDLPFPTEKDRRELEVAAEKNVDLVAASFVRDGSDIIEINNTLEEFGADVPVVAKIERKGAVENLDDIIEETYGVMVARGDLGVELPLEKVPVFQKQIIRKCNEAGIPVITATEMLDSMEQSRRPTRAESSDVANAVFDGTDAVMLSGETAIGAHPARTVETMHDIVRATEQSDVYERIRDERVPPSDESQADALAHAARTLADDLDAAAIVAASESGYTALKTAKFRPSVPIVATTPNDRVRRQLGLSWGIHSVTTPYTTEGADAIIHESVQAALRTNVAESGDTVVVVSGMMTDLEGVNTSNMLKIHIAAETLVSGEAIVSGLATGPLVRVEDGDVGSVPDRAILAIPADFDGDIEGDISGIGGIVDARETRISPITSVARDHGVPMIIDAAVPTGVDDGTTVTIDAERGVLYEDVVSDYSA
ncbi:pyruvate kinase [Halococcoides cellulosivorans]|uniref:Pyruvate kinase n=1 Tax=Halococcoides cellulosivorans TaxID=1679096 RepID=A0A2R4X159_9EURY|nr:pyruvate kinase [Halococcoides cellulosivorans]AWB27473.1 pyruvate kinase [Halococcoides cellulosivorans]